MNPKYRQFLIRGLRWGLQPQGVKIIEFQVVGQICAKIIRFQISISGTSVEV